MTLSRKVFACDLSLIKSVTVIHMSKEKTADPRAGTRRSRSCRQRSYNLFLLILLFCTLLPQPVQAQTATPVGTPTTTATSPDANSNAPMATPTADQLAEQVIQDHITTIFEAMSPADRVGLADKRCGGARDAGQR